MRSRDYQDIVSGAVLILIGVFATIHALTSLSLGTISRMGPGMFPAAIGFILAIFGAVILVPALFRAGEFPRIDIRSFASIFASILAFAMIIRPFGMIPAIIALTLIASRADSKLSLFHTAILAAGLSLGSTLIFQVALGVPVAAFAWPW